MGFPEFRSKLGSDSIGRNLMKVRSLTCAIFLFFVTLIPGIAQNPPAKTPTPLEQTLVVSEKTLIDAKKKDDAAFLKRIVAEDFSLVGVDGRLLQQLEAVGDLGDGELVELTPYDIKVVAAGEGAAIVTYDAIVRKKPEEDQGPPPRYQHFTSVWVKQGDVWKLKFHQATAAHWGDW
jgi:hypothetical protein